MMDIDILEYRLGFNVSSSYGVSGNDITSFRCTSNTNNNSSSSSSSSSLSKKVVDVLETSTGLIIASITVDGSCDKVMKSDTTIVTCDCLSGTFTCYDIDTKLIKGSFQKKLKPGQVIDNICISRDIDGFYFFTCSGESLVHAFALKDEDDEEDDDETYFNDTSTGITLLHGFNVDKKSVFDNAFKGCRITSIMSHPTLPTLFIITTGGIQVWTYKNLLKLYYTNDVENIVKEEDDIGDVDDNSSTTASVTESSVSGVKPKHKSSMNQRDSIFTDKKKLLNKWLMPQAMILPPPFLRDGKSQMPININFVSLEMSGRLIVVNWDGIHTALYERPPIASGETSSFNELRPVSTPYIAGPMTFHPTEPLILQSVLIGKKIILNALSLIDLSLSLLGRHELELPFETGKLVSIQSVPVSGRIILAFQNPNKSETFSLKIYSMTSEWKQKIGSMSSPIITTPDVASDLFFTGNSTVECQEGSDNLDYSLLMIRSKVETIVNSVKYVHDIFGLKITNSAVDSSCIFVGSLDFKVGKPNMWLKGLSDDHILPDDSYFTPSAIRIKSHNSSKENFIIIHGVSFGKTNESINLNSSVCLLRHSRKSLDSTYLNFRDAHFLNEETDKQNVTVLVLCSSGFLLKSLTISPSGECSEIAQWSLHNEVLNFWLSPAGFSLFATSVKNQHQSLIVSNIGDFNTNKLSRTLKFLPMEKVLDVQWQSSSDSKRKDEGSHLIAILTNGRLMIMTPKLDILNMYAFGSKWSHTSRSRVKSVVSSMFWFGSALIFITEDGFVSYLLPKKYSNPTSFKLSSLSICLGLDSKDYYLGVLFTLPRHECLTGAPRIATVLSDRIVIAYSSLDTYTGASHSYLIRPCFSIEPFIMGLLSDVQHLYNKSEPSDVTDDRYAILKKLIIIYFSGLQSSSVAGNGFPSTQSTRNLVFALSSNGFPTLATLIGITFPATDGNSVFSKTRWIPAAVKMKLVTDLSIYELGCSELLAAKAESRDTFLYPDSDILGGSPCIWSSAAQQYIAASHFVMNRGHLERARRVAQLAGNFFMLTNQFNDDLTNFKDLYQNRDIPLQYTIKDYLSDAEVHLTSHPTRELNCKHITGYSKQILIQTVHASVDTETECIDLEAFVELEKSNLSKNGFGRPTKLSMDWLEDWVGGRTKLEVLSQKHDKSVSICTDDEPEPEESSGMPEGFTKPSTWVEDVGRGKEWDKVVGYWRFSDIVCPGDEEFTNSGIPGARLATLDLSKYAHNLELFCDDNAIKLEESTSYVDPGEDHSTVKFLYDIVFSKTSCNMNSAHSPSHGLRTIIHRGGPLDVGLFHVDRDRSKLTIEVCALFAGACESRSCLFRRVYGMPPNDNDVYKMSTIAPIWEVYVNVDGSISFHLNSDGTNIIKTEPNLMPSVSSERGLEFNNWSHIVVVIDSTNKSVTSSSRVFIQIYVNGDDAAKGILNVDKISENDLSQTTLYIGPDLSSGWRLTELRLWAETRTKNEINAMRENYLPLASKRKRLHYQIKGKKGLFGKLDTQLFEVGPPANDIIFSTDKKVFLDSSKPKKTAIDAPGLLKALSRVPLVKARSDNKGKVITTNLKSIADSQISSKMSVVFDFSTMNCDVKSCHLTKVLALPDIVCVRISATDFALIKHKDQVASRKVIKTSSHVISLLYSPRPLSDQKRTVIAAYESNGSECSITVYAHDDATADDELNTASNMSKVVHQKVPNLQYWAYTGLDTILMITESSAFSWKADGRQTKPIKLLDRVDCNQGSHRRIIDCSWTIDGWLMLTTADNQEEATTTTTHQTLSPYLVSIYNVKSGQCYSFHALSGCFIRSGIVLEHLQVTTFRALSSFELLSTTITTAKQDNALILNVNDLVESKDTAPFKLRWSTQFTADIKHRVGGGLVSILHSESDRIFHLDCHNCKTTTFDGASGGIVSSIPNNIDVNQKVFSYYIDTHNRNQPAWLLLLGESGEKLDEIVRIDLII